jgi:hypothetical protein
LKEDTENEIINLTISTLQRISEISELSIDELKKRYPYHAIFFPDEALPYAKLERSIVTRVGKSYIPSLAEIVAKAKYSDVHREHTIKGEVDTAKLNEINNIVNNLRGNATKPDHLGELALISRSKGNTSSLVKVIADLYIGDHEDGQIFIELKSPKPNLDVCAESKRKMLTFLALKIEEQKKARAWLALTYNPDGEGMPYKHWATKSIMDMDHQVVIGKQLWDLIGGAGTFEEVSRVASKAKEIYYNQREGK